MSRCDFQEEERNKILRSKVEQLQGDIADLLHSVKVIRLAYLGYNEPGLEIALQHVSRMIEHHADTDDHRMDSWTWWNTHGMRTNTSGWPFEQAMQWAYEQGLKA